MTIKIESIVVFTGLQVGVPVSLPHGLINPPRKLVPDIVAPDEGGFLVSADDTDITVTRLAITSPPAVSVWASSWHTIRREFGATQPQPGIQPDGSLIPQPFVINQGVSQTGEAAVSAKMEATIVQNLLANVSTKIAFDTVEYDFGNIANVGLDRFVISEPGRYHITGQYAVTTAGAQSVRVSISINNALVQSTEIAAPLAGLGPTPVIATDLNLATGDFLELFAFTSTAGATIVDTRRPRFSVHSLF